MHAMTAVQARSMLLETPATHPNYRSGGRRMFRKARTTGASSVVV